jgi:ribosomal protein L11 methyltransferase
MRDQASWLEISLTVDGEMAEAVAEVLARYAPNGVVLESTQIAPDPEGEGYPTGPLRVCAYLPVDERLEETRQRLSEALYFLGRIRPLPEPVYEWIKQTNWIEAWRQHYRPIAIGERLIIVPAWLASPDDTRLPIRIDPGMAFGTGTHPTTQLVLELLEMYTPQDGVVLDIGSGSGILAIAAVKLGARHAYGVDIEAEALPAAQQNAAFNQVAGAVTFLHGSLEDVQSGTFPVRQAPLVLANIIAPILMRLLDAGLARLIAPQGVLILSGILEEQMQAMRAKLDEHGLTIRAQRQVEDWVALVVKKLEGS